MRMYAYLFSLLPGPTWVKWIFTLVILALVVVLLMEVVFPALAPYSPFSDSTIDE
ncbi:hypothetical protein [Citricoccus sp. NR2]|uniref:hypothetical protein n=1 Tax=Citricoccus sp. NR2 TaxID=3004095 RepID=UPI0022DCFA55|nr:hypothetical protein [Citricoccus sp. NR2]WBL19871.1 hypothetical protein O1A05_04025 [Citricoccus sp. NR2]